MTDNNIEIIKKAYNLINKNLENITSIAINTYSQIQLEKFTSLTQKVFEENKNENNIVDFISYIDWVNNSNSKIILYNSIYINSMKEEIFDFILYDINKIDKGKSPKPFIYTKLNNFTDGIVMLNQFFKEYPDIRNKYRIIPIMLNDNGEEYVSIYIDY